MTLDKPENLPETLDLYTIAEICAILSVSQKVVRGWIKAGLLPAIRLGPGQRLLRVRRVALEAFINHAFAAGEEA